MGMAFKHAILRLRVCTHLMVGHSTVLSLGQAVVGFHGAEVVAGSLAAGEDSVVGGGNARRPRWNPVGIGHPIPISPHHKQKEEEV